MKKLVKRKIGRPTKYRPEMIKGVEDYTASCSREQTALPTIEGLAIYFDVVKDTIYKWSKKYPLFSDALKKITDKQKNQLMNDGMYGGKEVNAAMAIFLLKANHGLKDGSQVNVNIDARKLYVVQAPNRDNLEATPETSGSIEEAGV